MRARGIVSEYGEDSLSPFILRPDKSFEFAGDGVVAYRVVGETVVVSADPVGPESAAIAAFEQLLQRARRAGLARRGLRRFRTPSRRVSRPRSSRAAGG